MTAKLLREDDAASFSGVTAARRADWSRRRNPPSGSNGGSLIRPADWTAPHSQAASSRLISVSNSKRNCALSSSVPRTATMRHADTLNGLFLLDQLFTCNHKLVV